MKIATEISSLEYFEAWSGGKDTLNDIIAANKIAELDCMFEELFSDSIPTETQVNDWLWFDREYIYENLGLDENGQLPEDEDEDEN